eukprot:766770-Hanusia_phi.AAC.3
MQSCSCTAATASSNLALCPCPVPLRALMIACSPVELGVCSRETTAEMTEALAFSRATPSMGVAEEAKLATSPLDSLKACRAIREEAMDKSRRTGQGRGGRRGWKE